MDAKTKKIVVIGSIALFVIAVIIIIIWYVKSRKKSDNPNDTSNVLQNTLATTGAVNPVDKAYVPESFPLKRMMQGSNVSKVQHYLNMVGANLSEDGYFGKNTEDALLKLVNTTQVSQLQFDVMMKALQSGTPKSALPTTISQPSTSTDMDAYVAKLNNDLNIQVYWLGRDGQTAGGLYTDLSRKPDTELKSIAQAYKAYNGGRILYIDIKNARFAPSPSDGTAIKGFILQRLTNIGAIN